MKYCILLLVVLVSTSAFRIKLKEKYEQWKKAYNKVYANAEEEGKRFEIWMENFRYVALQKFEADIGVHSFVTEMNEFSDLKLDEFKVRNGYKMQNRTSNSHLFKLNEYYNLPKEVDWRKKGLVTEVKNQGECGSCWAFSTTGSLEGQHIKYSGDKKTDLSEQNLVDCSQRFGNHGCEGGTMDGGFAYIKQNHGIDSEQSYPYEARDGTCRFQSSFVEATDKGYRDVPKTESALQQAVANVGPISVAIDASHQSFQLYQSGVYYEPACKTDDPDHGVLVVGYGVEDGKSYWLVKNSWGTDWGENGYIKMSRDRGNNCGIAYMASYPLVDKDKLLKNFSKKC